MAVVISLFWNMRNKTNKVEVKIIMKRVKQISFDILVDEGVDGMNLADEVSDFLEANGYRILGAGFQEDVTEFYEGWGIIVKE